MYPYETTSKRVFSTRQVTLKNLINGLDKPPYNGLTPSFNKLFR